MPPIVGSWAGLLVRGSPRIRYRAVCWCVGMPTVAVSVDCCDVCWAGAEQLSHVVSTGALKAQKQPVEAHCGQHT